MSEQANHNPRFKKKNSSNNTFRKRQNAKKWSRKVFLPKPSSPEKIIDWGKFFEISKLFIDWKYFS